MSPIPGEPLEPTAPELTTSDGRKFKLKLPGAPQQPEREDTEEREKPAPPVNPDQAG